jgi:hypothetical protein
MTIIAGDKVPYIFSKYFSTFENITFQLYLSYWHYIIPTMYFLCYQFLTLRAVGFKIFKKDKKKLKIHIMRT